MWDDADLNWYDYGFRNYDPQIGRFAQLDPLTNDYPELTNYQYASNDPILNIDLDGLEGIPTPGGLWNGSFLEQGARFGSQAFTRPAPSLAGTALREGSLIADHKIADAYIKKALKRGFKNRVKNFLIENGSSLLKKTALTIFLTVTPVETGKELTPRQLYERLGYPKVQPESEPENDDKDIYVYRLGGYTDKTFTPRSGKDDNMNNPKFGVSVELTNPLNGPYQRLSVKALFKNGFTFSFYKGHTSVIPSGPNLAHNLKSCAATRPTLMEV